MAPDCLNLHIENGMPALYPVDMTMQPGHSRAWLFRFFEDAQRQEGLLPCLSDEELARARAFVLPAARNQYIQTRAVLRMLLGGLLKRPAESLSFDYGPYGKPFLPSAAGCCFNVAHSGDYALLAVSWGVQVGVDIERQRETDDLNSLARMVLSPDEAGAWTALPMVERVPAFFTIWTAKEALVKATGRGLGLGLSSLDVGGLPAAVPQAGHRVKVGESGWCRLTQLDVPSGYAAALAVHETA